jgi:hypothetical protein
MEMLKAHNARVLAQSRSKPNPAHTYEPRTQSVAAMREWEKRSGRKYLSLSHTERWEANQQINEWAAANAAAAR